MKALTIKQPWAWAIVHGSKRVENRTWRPSPKLIGQRFAIHAAKIDDRPSAGTALLPPQNWPCHEGLVRSAIIGTARLLHVVDESDFDLAAWFDYDGKKWFFGPKGFILDDVVACEPFPCKGALGFWEAPTGFVDPWHERTSTARLPLDCSQLQISGKVTI